MPDLVAEDNKLADPQNVPQQIRRISAATKREAFRRSGNQCAFPGCEASLLSPNGAIVGEFCNIESLSSGGPRYNAQSTAQERLGLDNLLVLCPTHHRLIDAMPDLYTIGWLRQIREGYETALDETRSEQAPLVPRLEPAALRTFKEAISFWEKNSTNQDEEFWQNFFNTNPFVLAQAFPDSLLKLKDKCYMGGKDISNQNGNLIDFLYRSSTTKNVVLIEIKTPAMRLLGRQYRGNAYSISEQLSGSIVQALNYREELLKSYYMLAGNSPDRFNASAPRCVVLGGSLLGEEMDTTQRRSFELFRWSQHTTVLTYDELFAKLRDIVDLGDT